MNISEVAKRTGLTAKSIRLYEDKQLISLPKRDGNGYRIYGEHHIEELRVIARAKGVGFTLDECRELVLISMNEQRMSAEVKQKATEKLDEVRRKILELQTIESQLTDWISSCPGDENSTCPIVDDLKRGCTR
ncbi:Cu(I)-responsive transcriptional regulator [Vibrio variabilis]|uniref:Cu(I)-responsive transcriptional regulator n=1 Tax=Vibrio variabilis TaxID=990271 RepID=UPI000DD98BEC|nr:Cu(I)-responsive transcriptional regulator [Vibrio variabilis]